MLRPAPAYLPTLPLVTVRSGADDDTPAGGFTSRRADASSNKLDATLFETPQSLSVVTRDLLDARQATSVNEALQGVAGVSSGGFGRRGWDDFNIRGQVASGSMYVDGMRLGGSNSVAQEQYGLEQIDVAKGPGTLFGMIQPGGIVNLVTKRPRTEAFSQASATLGSYGYRQGAFDVGRPVGHDSRAAFRLVASASNEDDATAAVWARKRYIAPSLTVDLGPDTDLTFLASYANRQYIRQQGLPVKGSLQTNINGVLPRDLFVGEASFGPYDATQQSVAYALTHRFSSGWKLQQNMRALDMDTTGRIVTLRTLAANQATQTRRGSLTHTSEQTLALDTSLSNGFDTGTVQHALMVGLELNRDRYREGSRDCTVPSLNIFAPVYGVPVVCPAADTSDVNNVITYAALYARDQIRLTESLRLNVGVRRDEANTKISNYITPARSSDVDAAATTGNVGLLFKMNPHVAPYAAYSTSFRPRGGTDFSGAAFRPEKGVQAEAGLKFQFFDERLSASLAAYDLRRKNNLATDLEHPAFRIQTGEERSKGFEAELGADLRNGWSLTGAFAYTDAVVSQDTTGRVGQVLQNVPKRSASFWTDYRFQNAALNGWGVGVGARYESAKTNEGMLFDVPGYAVVDASATYRKHGYRIQLNVKNLLDRDYYAGALSNDVLPLGDPRTILLKVIYDF